MKKIISRLGWPGALLLLVLALAFGVYIIVNQSITDNNISIINKDNKQTVENKDTKEKTTIKDQDLLEKSNESTLNENLSNEKISKSEKVGLDEEKIKIEVLEEKVKNQSTTGLVENIEINDTQLNNLATKEKSSTTITPNNEIISDKKNDSLVKSKEDNLVKEEDNLVKKEETKVDIVRVDESGNTVIAGNAEPSTTVEAKIGEKIIGKTEVDEDGEFVITGQVFSSNDPQELKIVTKSDKQIDISKKVSKENDEDWVYKTKSFLILPGIVKNKDNLNFNDQKLEDVTIIELEKEDFIIKQEHKPINVEKLTLDRIKYSENGTAILFGRARTDMHILVYLNNNFQTKTTPGFDGGWTIDLGFIKPGIYKLRIDETTNDGEVKFRIETPFKQETKDLLDKMFTKAITVQPGNSLWRIARRIYGRGIMYIDIYNKNSHLIKDPDLIYPGQIFSLLD